MTTSAFGLPVVALALAWLGLLCGCPQDPTTNGVESETGGPFEPEPVDPFDDEGDDPPGAPDPTLVYRPPTTLGNGLVHDTRLDLSAGTHNQQVSLAQLAAGVEWSGFVTSHADKLRVGFRPTEADFAAIVAVQRNQGYRPISVSSRMRMGAAEYAGVFVQDGVAPQDWQVMLGAEATALRQDVPQAWADGYYRSRAAAVRVRRNSISCGFGAHRGCTCRPATTSMSSSSRSRIAAGDRPGFIS